MDSLIGRTLGSYQILQELGKGGMATVYQAIQPSLNRYVALKILPPYFAHDDEFVRRFRFEAEAAARLKHSNIVTIYDVGVQEGIYYIAQEFVQGDTLAELIRREGSLVPSRAVAILRQIASALDYAHALGFVHRDVKPSNIIVGLNDHATLTDFGIVRAMEGTRATKSGVMVGTPEYMAPEQIRGQAVDGRADIYALGIVAYEMLSGRVPFQGDTARVLHAQVYETPTALRSINPRLSQSLQSAITRALAKDPAQRFPRATDFVNALDAAAGARTTRTMEREQPREFAIPKRNTFLILASAAVLTLLVLFVALMLNRAGQPTNVALSGETLPPVTMNVGTTATPFVVPAAVNTVAPTWTRTSTHTNTSQPSFTPTQTSTPLPTRTFTRTRTSTHTPTRTLTRTRTRAPSPMPTSVLVPNAIVTFSDEFNKPTMPGWRKGFKANAQNGLLQLRGEIDLNAEGRIWRYSNLQDRTGLSMQFKYSQDAVWEIFFETGRWQESTFKRWGVSYRVFSGSLLEPDVYEAKDLVGEPDWWEGHLNMNPDQWYWLLLQNAGNGDFIARIWDPNIPSDSLVMHKTMNSNWAGKVWWVGIDAYAGILELKNYQESDSLTLLMK